MTRFDVLTNLIKRGEFWDVYLEDSQHLSLRWENSRVESISSSQETGLGLRFLQGLETRYGTTTVAHPLEGQFSAAEKDRLHHLVNDLSHGLPAQQNQPSSITPDEVTSSVLKPPSTISLPQKIAMLERAYKITEKGSGLRQVVMNYGEKEKKIGYLNSVGESFLETRIYLVFGITITAEKDGVLQSAYESLGGVVGFEFLDGESLDRLVERVVERVQKKLVAPHAPVGKMPVVIASSAGGTLIHEAVGHSLEADAVLEGTSPAYVGKIGHPVAHAKLNVFDNPTVAKARGSYKYDDEGVRSEATHLIENGVLRDYMFDRLSAKRAGRASNGHGRRESFLHRPIPRMSNTYVAPGPDDPREVEASLQEGLLVTKMGGGQVNTANGDFVFDVEEGYHVKNGRRELVKGATLLGNGPQVLINMDLVGSDHGMAIGTCGKEGQGVPVSDALPTVRIKELVVGGRS